MISTFRMSEEEGKARKVGFSTDQGTVAAINDATVAVTKKAGKGVPASQVITLMLKIGGKYLMEYLKSDEDVDVPIKEAQDEFRKKMEELKE